MNRIKMSSLVLNDKHIPRPINGTWKGKLQSNTIKYFLMTKKLSQKTAADVEYDYHDSFW